MLEYTHFVPGRLRLKIPELRNQRRAAETAAEIRAMPAVTKVIANPATGSLTINYDRRELVISDLWEKLSAKGYVSGLCPQPVGAKAASVDGGSTQRFAPTILAALFDALIQQSAQVLVRELL
jgi:Heavy metal associated domain 2